MSEYNPFFKYKALIHSDKCRTIAGGDIPTPVILHVYPTNKCNQRCKFCIMAKERNEHRAELGRDVFARLMDDANAMGIETMQIVGGGEPTLYPHLDLVDRFQGYKALTTNGARPGALHYRNFDRIRISLNAGTPETYARLCGQPSTEFYTVLESIETARTFADTGLAFVACAENWQEIPKIVRIAEEKRLSFVHIRPAYYNKGTVAEEEIRRLAPSIAAISDAAKNAYDVPVYSITDKFKGFWGDREYSRCRATPLHCVVSATGELIVCLDVFKRFGDLNKQRLTDIWGSAEHREAIDSIDVEDCPRCVMGRANELIENVFVNDNVIGGLI